MNIEELIQSKADTLHTETPSFAVWNAIQKATPKAKIYTLYWAAAASIIAIMGIAIVILSNQQYATKGYCVNSNIPIIKQTLLPQIKNDTQYIVNKTIQNQPNNSNANITKVQPTTQLQQPPTKDIAAIYNGQNYFDSVILVLKDKIASTPVRWVSTTYFDVYLTQYKHLEEQETIWKKNATQQTIDTDYIMQLIQINQQKITVLDALLKQMKNLNIKKGDTADTYNNNIII